MHKKIKAVIPAAGMATRFLPASKAVPKEMFPIYDKPSIQYIAEELNECGVEDMIFVTRRGKEAVEDHFDYSDKRFNYDAIDPETADEMRKLDKMINVIAIRQKDPKGLGHAVLTAAPCLDNSAFAVALPDDIVVSNGKKSFFAKMMELHEKEDCSVIALIKVPRSEISKYGIAIGEEKDGVVKIESLVEKPDPSEVDSDMAIIGRYILDGDVLDILENLEPGRKGEIQLTDAINKLAKTKKVYGLLLSDEELRFDSGDKNGYVLVNVYMALKNNPQFKEDLKNFCGEFF